MGQVRLDIDTSDMFVTGLPISFSEESAIFAQDAGIAQALAQYTLVGKIAASGKWALYDPTATDGSAQSLGIYLGESVLQATIVAGDVSELPILTGDALLIEDKLNIEGATTLATVIGTGVTAITVRDALASQGIRFRLEQPISAAQR